MKRLRKKKIAWIKFFLSHKAGNQRKESSYRISICLHCIYQHCKNKFIQLLKQLLLQESVHTWRRRISTLWNTHKLKNLSEQGFWVKMTQVPYQALSEAQVPVNVNFGSFPYQAENGKDIIWCFKQHYPRNGCISTAGEHLHTFMWICNLIYLDS